MSSLTDQHITRGLGRWRAARKLDDWCPSGDWRCGRLFSCRSQRRFRGFIESFLLLDGGEEVRPAEASVAGQLIVEKIGRLQTSQYLFKAGETLGFSAAWPVELVPKKINFFFWFRRYQLWHSIGLAEFLCVANHSIMRIQHPVELRTSASLAARSIGRSILHRDQIKSNNKKSCWMKRAVCVFDMRPIDCDSRPLRSGNRYIIDGPTTMGKIALFSRVCFAFVLQTKTECHGRYVLLTNLSKDQLFFCLRAALEAASVKSRIQFKNIYTKKRRLD